MERSCHRPSLQRQAASFESSARLLGQATCQVEGDACEVRSGKSVFAASPYGIDVRGVLEGANRDKAGPLTEPRPRVYLLDRLTLYEEGSVSQLIRRNAALLAKDALLCDRANKRQVRPEGDAAR